MDEFTKLIFFYYSNNIDCKDIETEIFTDKREKINFFLFHNRDLHFSKSEIFKKTLIKKFESIPPEFQMLENELIMFKSISNFKSEDLDKLVDEEYADYINKINYRIECIFQTFSLFLGLYKEKNIVFIFPLQLFSQFEKHIDEYGIKLKKIDELNNMIKQYDIVNSINYYLRKDISQNTDELLKENNIVSLYKIES